MKATGIVRKIDELGRIVIPIELRRSLGLEIKDPVEIYMEGKHVVLRKYETSCIFCGGEKSLDRFKEKVVCKSCKENLLKTLA